MPTPGSVAHKEREARMIKKGKAVAVEETPVEATPETPAQRVQPVSKARAKKKPKGKK